MCSRAYAFPASRVLFSLVVFAEQPNTREKRPRKVGKHAHFLLAHRLITRRIWGTTELSKRVNSSRGHAYRGPTVYLLSDGVLNSVVLSMDSFFLNRTRDSFAFTFRLSKEILLECVT